MMRSGKIELLAPARDLQTGQAAIDFGADALYIGGPHFGARAAAANTAGDIARLVQYARPFGVRVYAALNTLVYENELERAREVALELIGAGVDALIVQDMAFLRMNLPPIELHASTQTHNVSDDRVKFLEQCGFSRVILERGLSLARIRAIRAATNVDLEAFVHGAICVGYSGRCYLSRCFGARSGNRGDCAQPCRQSWNLVGADGRDILAGKHLLSLRDLNLSERLGELIAAGVTSFKIEGRLKDAAYVKNIVAFYRQAIDGAQYDFRPDPARSFSRGFTEYFIDGPARGIASFDTPKAIGALVGMVESADDQSFTLDTREELAAGDGICFEGGGVNINRVEGRRIFPNRMEGIVRGMAIFRNHDQRFEAALKASHTRRLIDVAARVEITRNHISLILNQIRVWIENRFEAARNSDQALAAIEAAVSKSGQMPFRVGEVRVECAIEIPFIPTSVLNDLRRRAMEALLAALETRIPERKIGIEDPAARLPQSEIGAQENVTNSLAERFYRDHGATRIARGRDLLASMRGQEVMRSPYCLRREIGQCLRENPTLRGPLTLRHGDRDFTLEFDCDKCEMKLIYQ